MPWEFWTDEERSLVIKEGYKDLVLTSTEVKPYLNASKAHFYAQWLIPIIAAGVCYGPLRVSLLARSYRKSPSIGFKSTQQITQIVPCCLEVSPSPGSTLALSTFRSKASRFEHWKRCGAKLEAAWKFITTSFRIQQHPPQLIKKHGNYINKETAVGLANYTLSKTKLPTFYPTPQQPPKLKKSSYDDGTKQLNTNHYKDIIFPLIIIAWSIQQQVDFIYDQ